MYDLSSIDNLDQDEEARWVPGWEGRYAVTNQGRVFSFTKHPIWNREGKPRQIKGGRSAQGYRRVTIRSEDGWKWFDVHVAVLEAFVGPRPEGEVARHLNGDPEDNRISNLRWGTMSENYDDARVHDTNYRGEDQHLAKLTEDDVREMRKMYEETDLDCKDIAKRFNVGHSAAWRAITKRTWKHVE